MLVDSWCSVQSCVAVLSERQRYWVLLVVEWLTCTALGLCHCLSDTHCAIVALADGMLISTPSVCVLHGKLCSKGLCNRVSQWLMVW